VGYDDSTRAPIQGPRGSSVGGSVKHIVDIFRSSCAGADISLECAVDNASARVVGQPVPRVYIAYRGSRLIVYGEVRRVRAIGDRPSHVTVSSRAIVAVEEVIVTDVHVVLSHGSRVPGHDEPGLINRSWRGRIVPVGSLCDRRATRSEPIPC